ncbi:MAG: hypothetical protein ACK5MP_05055 [Nostocoides sp.]
MSIPVDIDRLDEALADFGSGYVMTITPENTVKALTVDPLVRGRLVVVTAASRGTAANLATNDAITIVMPPTQHHGYTLIIDGSGVPDGDQVLVTPTSAVLHRPSHHADGPPPPAAANVPASSSNCGQDCRRL